MKICKKLFNYITKLAVCLLGKIENIQIYNYASLKESVWNHIKKFMKHIWGYICSQILVTSYNNILPNNWKKKLFNNSGIGWSFIVAFSDIMRVDEKIKIVSQILNFKRSNE